MDIDSNLASSSLKRSSDTPDSPIDKRPKYDSVQADLEATLNTISSVGKWSHLVQSADSEDGEPVWQYIFERILVEITHTLASTNRKGEFINELTLTQAREILKGFSPEDIKIWRDGVRKGLKDGNWEDLIHHRACTYDIRR